MSSLDKIADLLHRLPMDAEGRAAADKLIADARAEQAELVEAIRELYDPLDHHGRRENVEAMLTRFQTPLANRPLGG